MDAALAPCLLFFWSWFQLPKGNQPTKPGCYTILSIRCVIHMFEVGPCKVQFALNAIAEMFSQVLASGINSLAYCCQKKWAGIKMQPLLNPISYEKSRSKIALPEVQELYNPCFLLYNSHVWSGTVFYLKARSIIPKHTNDITTYKT